MKKLLITLLLFILPTLSFADEQAKRVSTSVTNFNNVLSSSDTTVQRALDTLDNSALNQTSADTLYIRKDGTSTTTAQIPFSQGLSVADSAKIYIGGTDSSNSAASISNTGAATLTIQGYHKITDFPGTDIQVFGGDGAAADAIGGMVRLYGGAVGAGGDTPQNGFVTVGINTTSFSLSNTITGGVSLPGNNRNDFAVEGSSTFTGPVSFTGGIGLGANLLPTASYMLLLSGLTDQIISMDRHSSTSGKNLSIMAGWAASGTTNTNGGILKLMPGKPTGTGTANVEIYAAGGGVSGTSDSTPSKVMDWGLTSGTFRTLGYTFISDTTTGVKFGSATTQKFSFYNATPVAQQTATTDLGKVLSNFGIRASGTAYPITTSGLINFTNSTDSSSTSTGSVILSGGMGIAKSLYAGTTSLSTLAVQAGGASGYIVKVGGVIFNDFADATVGGAEADIYTYTIPASMLNTNGQKVIASYSGQFTTVGTEATQLKVYLAGTAIWDSTAVVPATGTTSWKVSVELIRKSSSVVIYSVTLTTTNALGYTYATTSELTGLTLTGTNILKITGTSSGTGSGAGDIVGKMSYGEWKPAA